MSGCPGCAGAGACDQGPTQPDPDEDKWGDDCKSDCEGDCGDECAGDGSCGTCSS